MISNQMRMAAAVLGPRMVNDTVNTQKNSETIDRLSGNVDRIIEERRLLSPLAKSMISATAAGALESPGRMSLLVTQICHKPLSSLPLSSVLLGVLFRSGQMVSVNKFLSSEQFDATTKDVVAPAISASFMMLFNALADGKNVEQIQKIVPRVAPLCYGIEVGFLAGLTKTRPAMERWLADEGIHSDVARRIMSGAVSGTAVAFLTQPLFNANFEIIHSNGNKNIKNIAQEWIEASTGPEGFSKKQLFEKAFLGNLKQRCVIMAFSLATLGYVMESCDKWLEK